MSTSFPVFVIIYISSAFASYKFIQKSHGPGGRWQGVDPMVFDAVLLFIPVWNTLFALFSWGIGPYESRGGREGVSVLVKFFRIKK